MIGYVKESQSESKLEPLKKLLLTILLPVLILVLWEWSVARGTLNGNVVPAPSTLWKTFLSLLTSGKLIEGLSISIRRVLIGFLMGLFAPFNRAMSSLVNILRPIPTIALTPIFIIVLGVGEATNVSIILIGAIWSILLNTTAGVMSVDRKLMELAYVYRLRKRDIVFRIILPSALYNIITGLRLGIGGAWMSVVAAEMIGATSGIGYMIMFAKSLAQAANMYVLVLVIGIIGFLIDRILLIFQKQVRKKFCGDLNG